MKNLKKALLGYGAFTMLGACIFWWVTLINGYEGSLDTPERYRILCDAFSVPAVLFIMLAALLSLSKHGVFDVIIYGVKRALFAIFPFGFTGDFYEYKMRRKRYGTEKYLLLTGTAFMIPAVVMLVALY